MKDFKFVMNIMLCSHTWPLAKLINTIISNIITIMNTLLQIHAYQLLSLAQMSLARVCSSSAGVRSATMRLAQAKAELRTFFHLVKSFM